MYTPTECPITDAARVCSTMEFGKVQSAYSCMPNANALKVYEPSTHAFTSSKHNIVSLICTTYMYTSDRTRLALFVLAAVSFERAVAGSRMQPQILCARVFITFIYK